MHFPFNFVVFAFGNFLDQAIGPIHKGLTVRSQMNRTIGRKGNYGSSKLSSSATARISSYFAKYVQSIMLLLKIAILSRSSRQYCHLYATILPPRCLSQMLDFPGCRVSEGKKSTKNPLRDGGSEGEELGHSCCVAWEAQMDKRVPIFLLLRLNH